MGPNEESSWGPEAEAFDRLPDHFFSLPAKDAAEALIRSTLSLDVQERTTLSFVPLSLGRPIDVRGSGSVYASIRGEGAQRTLYLIVLHLHVTGDEAHLYEAKRYFTHFDQPQHPILASPNYEIVTYSVDREKAKQTLKVMDWTSQYILYEKGTNEEYMATEGERYWWHATLERISHAGELSYRTTGYILPIRLPRYLVGNHRISRANSLNSSLVLQLREQSEPSQISSEEQVVQMLRRHLQSSSRLSDEMLILLVEIAGERNFKKTRPLIQHIQESLPALPEDALERRNKAQALRSIRWDLIKERDELAAPGDTERNLFLDLRGNAAPSRPLSQETKGLLADLDKKIERLDEQIDATDLSRQETRTLEIYQALQLGLLKLKDEPELRELEKLALLKTPECSWALRQLRDHFPDEYVSILSKRLDLEWEWKQDILLKEMEKQNPVVASREAKQFLNHDSAIIAAQALMTVLNTETLPNESHYLKKLLTRDDLCSYVEGIFNILVPEEYPGRLQDPQIEAALLRIVEKPDHSSYKWTLLPASKALVRRDKKKYLPKLIALYDASSPYRGNPYALEFLIQQTRDDPKLRDQVDSFFIKALSYSNRYMDQVIHLAWVLDLRMCMPTLQKLAELEDKEARTLERMKLLHFDPEQDDVTYAAGHVLTLWEDEDPMHNAKALISYVLQHPDLFYKKPSDPSWGRFNREFQKQRAGLSVRERAQLEQFLAWAFSKQSKETEVEKVRCRYLLQQLEQALDSSHE